jgi:hypothetical protein
MTLEEIVNSLKSAGQDYGQLFNNNPKYTAVASNVTKGLENLVPPQFTNTQDAKSQEYSKKLAEWALGNGMGMSGMALTFIGKNAANWNPVKAAEAEKMLNAGVDPAQVWKEHLIGRMPDKSLFSEIDDSVAKYLNKSELKSIDGKIIHDNLFNEYPDLKNINFEKITDNSAKASYQPDSYDPWGAHLPEEIGINEKRRSTNKDKLSNILHELQHGVQYREDFPVGGNLRIASDIINEKNHKIHSDVEEILGVYGYKDPRIKELLSKKLDPRNNDNLMSVYRRLTGEAQARATQDRMNMNMQQRRDTYPLAGGLLSDIPLDQLINRYRDN